MPLQFSYPGVQHRHQRLVCPKYWVCFSFRMIHPEYAENSLRTKCNLCLSSSPSPICWYPLPRSCQSVPQHEYLLRSENSVNYLANTQPICTTSSCSRHHLAPCTPSLKSRLKLTVFPWHIAVRFPRMASRCGERDTDPALVPTQYVCTSLLASGNDGDAASLTHHTELVSVWVSLHGSPAQQSASKKIYCFIWHSVIH